MQKSLSLGGKGELVGFSFIVLDNHPCQYNLREALSINQDWLHLIFKPDWEEISRNKAKSTKWYTHPSLERKEYISNFISIHYKIKPGNHCHF
jgi:hypothetical protein